MEIVLNKKYTIKSDSKQFILVESLDKQENLLYFSSLEWLIKCLIKKKIKMDKEIKTLSQLSKKIDEYAKEISNQIKDCM
jgi:ABC-type Na+ transport system ATPase subunit NatA